MLPLPDFLSADEHGFVSLANHRVGLHHVIRLYSEGYSPEMIAESFPTVSLASIHKTIAFYLDHRQDVDLYVSEQDGATSRQIAKAPPSPSLLELRQRLDERKFASPPAST